MFAWFGREELTVQEDMSSIWAELLALESQRKRSHWKCIWCDAFLVLPTWEDGMEDEGFIREIGQNQAEDVHSLIHSLDKCY